MVGVLFAMFVQLSSAGGDPRFSMDCAKRSALTVALRQAREAWRSFQLSNPGQHDPKKFTYVVHAFKDYINGNPSHWMVNIKLPYVLGGPFDRLLFERFSGVGSLSASMINQDKHGLFGPSAIILAADPDTVFAASRGDLGYVPSFRDPEAGLLNAFERNGLPSPADLMGATRVGSYNEVVVGFGHPPEGLSQEQAQAWIQNEIRRRVIGIIHTPEIRSGEWNGYRAVTEEFARRNGIPILWLDESEPR